MRKFKSNVGIEPQRDELINGGILWLALQMRLLLVNIDVINVH